MRNRHLILFQYRQKRFEQGLLPVCRKRFRKPPLHAPPQEIQRGEPVQPSVNMTVAIMLQALVTGILTVAGGKKTLLVPENPCHLVKKPHGVACPAGKAVVQIQINAGIVSVPPDTITADQLRKLDIQLLAYLKTQGLRQR